jgi:hypothetical protein
MYRLELISLARLSSASQAGSGSGASSMAVKSEKERQSVLAPLWWKT